MLIAVCFGFVSFVIATFGFTQIVGCIKCWSSRSAGKNVFTITLWSMVLVATTIAAHGISEGVCETTSDMEMPLVFYYIGAFVGFVVACRIPKNDYQSDRNDTAATTQFTETVNRKVRIGKKCPLIRMDGMECAQRDLGVNRTLENASFLPDDIGLTKDTVKHIYCMSIRSYPFFYSRKTELDALAFLASYIAKLCSDLYERLFEDETVLTEIGHNAEHTPLDTSGYFSCVKYTADRCYRLTTEEYRFFEDRLSFFNQFSGELKNQYIKKRRAFAIKLIADSGYAHSESLNDIALNCADVIISSIDQSFRKDIKTYTLNALDDFAYSLEQAQSAEIESEADTAPAPEIEIETEPAPPANSKPEPEPAFEPAPPAKPVQSPGPSADDILAEMGKVEPAPPAPAQPTSIDISNLTDEQKALVAQLVDSMKK